MELYDLCKKINTENPNPRFGCLSQYDFDNINPRDFILCNYQLNFGESYIFKILINYLPKLEKITLLDWVYIQENIESAFDTFSFISFVNKFIRVDFYKYLIDNNEINDSKLNYFYFKENIHYLDYYYSDQLFLSFQGIDLKYFDNLRTILSNSGVTKLDIYIFDKTSFSPPPILF